MAQIHINDGKAEIIVSGELPGTAALTFLVEGTDKTAITIASVEQITHTVVAVPTANIASGAIVEKGTKIELSCATAGATIYYTLDGSCPCDNTDARKVYDGTVAPDMTESDVAEFTYIVDGTGIQEVTINGQIQVWPLPVRDKVNVSAGGIIINSVTVSAMNGTIIVSSNKVAPTVTIDVSTVPSGIYIVNVTTIDGLYSRKILKVD